jgi:hypothetical protein
VDIETFERPVFNHVGFSLPRDALNSAGRKRIADFFGNVFGFEERTAYTKDREFMVLTMGGPDQLIVLFGSDSPTTATPPNDHWGMRCHSLEQLQFYCDRAREEVAKDGGIEFEDYSVALMEDMTPRHNLHRFYVRLGTPFTFEVQFYEWLDAANGSPTSAASNAQAAE